MKKEDQEFRPAKGVTMSNALRHVAAIEDAVRRECMAVPKEERSVTIAMIAGSLAASAETLNNMRLRLEESGESDPITEDQILQLKMLFRRALERNAPGS